MKFSASLAWVSQSCLKATMPTKMAAIKTDRQAQQGPEAHMDSQTQDIKSQKAPQNREPQQPTTLAYSDASDVLTLR